MPGAARKFHGTPATLREAIGYAIRTCIGRTIEQQFHAIIKDFLAQKFCAAQLTNPEQQKLLTDLFDECTKELK